MAADFDSSRRARGFLDGGGEVGALIGACDWNGSPLGPIAVWPQSLKSSVALVLHSPVPIVLLWGADGIMLYNDAFSRLVGARHPQLLGSKAREGWPDAAGFNDHVLKTCLAGATLAFKDQEFTLSRNGAPEQIWLDLQYSPVPDESGRPAGVMGIVTDTTAAMVSGRNTIAEQEKARAGEEFTSRVLSSSADCIKVLDLDARLEFLSEGGMCVMEVDDFGAIEGKAWPEFWEGDEHARALAAVEDAKAGGTGRFQGFARTAKGSPRWWDVIVTPINGADGRPEKLLSISRDVTATKETEVRLAESEERYRTLFEAIDAGFCIVEMKFDADGKAVDYRLAEINPAFERQTGLHGAAGKWVSEVAPGLERHWFDIYGQVALTGEATRFENHAEPFGRHYDVHAFRTGNPETHRVAILFNDITERKAAEDRLRDLNATLEDRVAERTAERNMLATLIETTDVMVMACDVECNILAVNQANADEFERIYGVRPKPGDNMLALLDDQPEHREQVRAGWSRGLAGEHVTMVEDFGDPDRVRPYYEINFRPLRSDAGELIGAYQFVTDVTDRLRREAQLVEAQEALRQSQKMEAMGQLTGGVAHDFNNLLTPIIGSLDMLQRRRIGGEREQRMIAGALQSADRAKILVQRLLAFARRQPLSATAIDVPKLLEGMADLVASTSGPQVGIVVHAPPGLHLAYGDLNQLEMAILNLAVNARDAMPDGGTLTLSAENARIGAGHRSKLPPGDYVCLCVTDTGDGMDEATLKRAIEPFFSTKGVGKGTGLGLSMVHGLASQLGGALTLSSQLGLGTKIELWLPVTSAEPATPEASATKAAAPLPAGRVLLVDDEAIVRHSTADMLTDLGYEVTEAESAQEALKLLDEGLGADLLLTDHLMPGMTGTDLAREVRSRWPDRPVLLISGFAEAEGVAPDLPRLTKPFRQHELSAALAALC